MNKLTCSVREAIEASGLGRTKLYELMNEGKLISVKIGTKRLINWASLQRLLIPSSIHAETPARGEQKRTRANRKIKKEVCLSGSYE